VRDQLIRLHFRGSTNVKTVILLSSSPIAPTGPTSACGATQMKPRSRARWRASAAGRTSQSRFSWRAALHSTTG